MECHVNPISPISQVLQSLGLTRHDLIKHSDQMRQFLTAEDAKSLRVITTTSEISDTQHVKADVFSSSSTTRSRSCSNSLVHATISATPPPSTPVKSEPTEPAIPLRRMDSMEMVMERKSRQVKREKRDRKEKERHAPSPTPASAGVSLDAFMKSRDIHRIPSVESSELSRSATPLDTLPPPPITPQPRKYYRDYDAIEPSSTRSRQLASFTPRPDSPTPTRQRTRAIVTEPDKNVVPITPRRNHYYKSPLPSSSPPQSSPFATPTAKRIVNLVSSPGPMGPLPDEEEYDKLPYTLPPGPYSTAKPDLSYAALVGQAILSSPEHRLTLQEIYDWITIVYPHFKRNETTWMNSIRHVLSTTACFRKVPRDRSIGRTLWAIFDHDLECFANGGFRKEFCADMKQDRLKKSASKKRPADEPPSGSGRRTKKSKKGAAPAADGSQASLNGSSLITPLLPPSHLLPLFPPTRPAAHHQPYYESCVTMPADVIFPPLPPSSGYHRILSASASASVFPSSLPPSSAVKSSEPPQTSPIPSSSLPSLVPNLDSSSSPALPSEDSSKQNDSEHTLEPRIVSTPPPDNVQNETVNEAISLGALEPTRLPTHIQRIDKGKKRLVDPQKTPPKKSMGLPPMPISPTLERKTIKHKKQKHIKEPPPPAHSSSLVCLQAPPQRPTTPVRNPGGSSISISPMRTPLSHKGIHMSPSPSLAHYKSHLDPPPVVSYRPDDGINPAVFGVENIRTPPRRRGHNHRDRDKDNPTPLPPLTPKKLVFPTPPVIGESPFRTPGARSIFDPHDPSALLDEELSAFGAVEQESPAGLFGGRKMLLYESPSMPSPGKWGRWF